MSPASRERKLRCSRSFILPPNWQNTGMIYAWKSRSADVGALHLPSSGPVSRNHSSMLGAVWAAPGGSAFLPPTVPRTDDCRRISHSLSSLISSNERDSTLAEVPCHTFVLIYPSLSQCLHVLQ